jgi:hypothetical protein
VGLENASRRTRTRVSRIGAKALHASKQGNYFTSESARLAAARRWGGKGFKYATQERQVSENGAEQHPDGDGGRQATEAGSSDSLKQSR